MIYDIYIYGYTHIYIYTPYICGVYIDIYIYVGIWKWDEMGMQPIINFDQVTTSTVLPSGNLI